MTVTAVERGNVVGVGESGRYDVVSSVVARVYRPNRLILDALLHPVRRVCSECCAFRCCDCEVFGRMISVSPS